MAAGALTVVASLWKVHDNSTRLLMKEFYARLVAPSSGQRDVARALQGAMRALIADGRSPVYWAAFVSYGLWSWEPGNAPRVAPVHEPVPAHVPPGLEPKLGAETVEEFLIQIKVPPECSAPYVAKMRTQGYSTIKACHIFMPPTITIMSPVGRTFSMLGPKISTTSSSKSGTSLSRSGIDCSDSSRSVAMGPGGEPCQTLCISNSDPIPAC